MSVWKMAWDDVRSVLSTWALRLATRLAPEHERISLAISLLDHYNRLEQLDDRREGNVGGNAES